MLSSHEIDRNDAVSEMAGQPDKWVVLVVAHALSTQYNGGCGGEAWGPVFRAPASCDGGGGHGLPGRGDGP